VESWRSAITNTDGNRITVRGHDLVSLMREGTYADVVALLLGGHDADEGERRLIDVMLIAVADHGAGAPSAATARMAASGNRQAPEAAVAAGILAIGDAHAGAGMACMAVIAGALERAARESRSLADVAQATALEARASGRRLPGLGHRLYREDPRTTVLFDMAGQYGKAGQGVAFMRALESAASEAIKPLPINVDGAMAAILHDLGYPAAAAKLLFIVGRTAGLAAHVIEEYTRERPMRVRIPVVYDGPSPVERPDRAGPVRTAATAATPGERSTT
jgi:citrate synthase